MDFIPEDIARYAAAFSQPESGMLQEVAAFTRQHHPHHHMLSGHTQGRILAMLSKLLRPRRILEVGTFTGYSALCLAEGLTDDGVLHTIEVRADDAATAAGFFNKSGYNNRIVLHVGAAADVIAGLEEYWDLVFIDADKTAYTQYYELILPRLRKNGLLIADNVLFHGQVTRQPVTGKNAVAIDDFNRYVAADPRVDCVMLTVRDGLMLARKL